VGIVWSDQYSVGVEKIDAQHKQIIDMINLLQDALAKKDASAEIKQVLLSLAEYAKTHFSYEEKLMTHIDYPGLAAHVREHARLTQEVQDMLKRLKRGDSVSARRLLSMLRSWWTTHIERDDMKYGEWIREHQASGHIGDLTNVC
jgi:hemerythrin